MISRGQRRRRLLGREIISKRDQRRYEKKWLETISWLNQEFPRTPSWEGDDPTVKVYIKTMERNWGEARGYEIYISKEVPWVQRFEMLLHEWAHILTVTDKDLHTKSVLNPLTGYKEISWQDWFNAGHNDEWALCYGRIYRAYYTGSK